MHQCIDFQDFNGIIYCVKIVSKGTLFDNKHYSSLREGWIYEKFFNCTAKKYV